MKVDGKTIYNKLTCMLTCKYLGHTVADGPRQQAGTHTSTEMRRLQPGKQTDAMTEIPAVRLTSIS